MDVFDLQGKASIDISPYVDGIKQATSVNEALMRNIEKVSDKVTSMEYYMRKVSGTVDDLTNSMKKQSSETENEADASEEAADETKKLGNEIQTTGDKSEKTTSKIKDLAEGIKNGLATAAKIGTAAVGAAAAGVGALVKESVENYSEYEQLVGGIKKIYGDQADVVIKNAEESLATSATNINEYLSGAISVSQTLLQSLGRGVQTDIDELQEALDQEYTMTKQSLEDQYDDVKEYWNERIKASKAAKDGEADALQSQRDDELKALKRSNEAQLKELKAHNKQVVAEAERANQQTGEITEETYQKAADYTDMIMRDVADNAASFGKFTAEQLTDVYGALSRGNYMTLDNLNLGYKGTKTELERLIADANDYAEAIGETGDMTADSFADIVRAIDLIQRKIGISETAAKEAGTTITGTIKGVKDAWTNVTIEMAKEDGDIDTAFETLGKNVGGMIENMLPKIENALGGVGNLITAAAPKITAGIKSLLPKVMPELLRTAGSLVSTVGQAVITSLPEMLDVGKELLKSIAEVDFSGNGMMGNLLDAIIGNVDDYLGYGEKILANIGNALINADHSKIGTLFSKVITSGLNTVTDLLADLDMEKVGQNIADFLNAIDWKGIARAVIDALGAAIGSLGEIAKGFFENMDGETFMNMWALAAAPKLLGGMLNAFKTNSECKTEFTNIGDFLSAEIGASGEGAGVSWSAAFTAGLEAFRLGWAIGTYLRDNVEFGGKTLGEWVDYAMAQALGDPDEIDESKWTGTEHNEMFTYVDDDGVERSARVYDTEGNYTGLYKKHYQRELERQGAERAQNWAGMLYNNWEEQQRRINGYATGGYVTTPQIATVAEKEPEYIIPESKMDSVYPRETQVVQNIVFNISGTFDLATPEDQDRLAEKVSEKLRMLSIAQQRAMGGAAW